MVQACSLGSLTHRNKPPASMRQRIYLIITEQRCSTNTMRKVPIMPVSLKKSPELLAAQARQNAEARALRDAESAFSLAIGFPMDDDRGGEKAARRARYERRRGREASARQFLDVAFG